MGADGAAARLDELACRHDLRPRQRAQLAAVLDLLAADPRAPTSVRAPERAVDVHIADSLAALDTEAIRAGRQIADLGAGAGFPGVALAVALPATDVSLLESQGRKCEFLRTLCATAGVRNARVVCARAEEWRAGLGRNDVALARALAPQPVVLEYAAPLLRAGGVLVDWRGRRRRQEERAAHVAARELGLEPIEVVATTPFRGSIDRHLHLYMKVRATPRRFPRRSGAARKRPLGGAIQA
jgi:16S rRNA (guanine527-N7)-methyltransferase